MIKKILGLCECPGCTRRAKKTVRIIGYDCKKHVFNVCYECAWWIMEGKL